jgi:bacterioferritin-associated ferredoxin
MVDRCICFSKSFSELKSLAQQHGARDVAALQTVAEFGLRCGLCKPYVQRMLSTGQTDFAVMPTPLHPFEDPGLFPDITDKVLGSRGQ